MRARVAKNDLAPAVMRTVSIADKKAVVPILSHVLLEFTESGLRLKASDLDHSIIENVAAEIDTFGTVAVPASTLNDIVRKAPENATLEFSLTDKGAKILVSAGKSKFEISTLDHADFPEITMIKEACCFKIASPQLSRLISRTKISMSPEESRHSLNGIFLHKEDAFLKAASTDGHRLSVAQVECDLKEQLTGVIISKKAVFEIKKLLDSYSGDVTVTFSSSQAQFDFGDIIFISKLVDGNFPDYKRVIPEANSLFFSVKRTEFIELIDRVAVISDDKVRSIKLDLDKNVLSCSAVNSKIGSGKDEVEVAYSGSSWSAGFNANYLLDVAQTLEGEKLKINIKESLSPSPILITDESEAGSLFVIMPMRV